MEIVQLDTFQVYFIGASKEGFDQCFLYSFFSGEQNLYHWCGSLRPNTLDLLLILSCYFYAFTNINAKLIPILVNVSIHVLDTELSAKKTPLPLFCPDRLVSFSLGQSSWTPSWTRLPTLWWVLFVSYVKRSKQCWVPGYIFLNSFLEQLSSFKNKNGRPDTTLFLFLIDFDMYFEPRYWSQPLSINSFHFYLLQYQAIRVPDFNFVQKVVEALGVWGLLQPEAQYMIKKRNIWWEVFDNHEH